MKAVSGKFTPLVNQLCGLIEQARQYVAQGAKSGLTLLYWKVGERIGREALRGQRAEYGEQIVSTLSTQWVLEYRKAFNASVLTRMVRHPRHESHAGTVAPGRDLGSRARCQGAIAVRICQ